MTPEIPVGQIPEGQYTATIYTYIREQRYDEVIKHLSVELQNFPKSRAALSLLAYSYYHQQDYANAAECYEQLTKVCPEVEHYQLYLAQSLFKASEYPEAVRACQALGDNQEYHFKIIKLQAAVKYEQDDIAGARALVEQCDVEDADTDINQGCLLFKEGLYDKARRKFSESMNMLGFQADLAYNIALCYYKVKQYAAALKHIADIIERGIREHGELNVGMATEGIDVRSVGNTQILRETALIEAFNLKAAIEYQLKNMDAAKEALTDMPPRSEAELDPVTLHNQALINMEDDPNTGFQKMQFLLQQNPCPPTTFGNLLLLYCKYQYYDLAADVLADYSHLTYKSLTPYLYQFLDATITLQTSKGEAFRKFDDLSK